MEAQEEVKDPADGPTEDLKAFANSKNQRNKSAYYSQAQPDG